MTIRVGVFGAAGRMGAEVCRAVSADPDLELVAAVDPHHGGLDLRQVTGLDTPLVVETSPEALARSSAEVVVDFTDLVGSRSNLSWCAKRGVHAVVGTTGFDDDDYAVEGRVHIEQLPHRSELRDRGGADDALRCHRRTVVRIGRDRRTPPRAQARCAIRYGDDDGAPNGRGFCRLAGRPHDDRGTARCAGSSGPAGIHVHSVRLRGLVAHQEVLLGSTGQSLSIRHDSYDRTSFMPGVVLAVKQIADRPGLTLGLDSLLGL